MHNVGLYLLLPKRLVLAVILGFLILHKVESQQATSFSPTTEHFPKVSATPLFNEATLTNSEVSNSSNSSCSQPGKDELQSGGAREVVGVVLVLVVFGTIFGNLLVITAVLTFHELQTITNMFVASLACADLIMGAFVMPIGIPYVLNDRWGLGQLFCDVWISVDVLTVTASIETLCAIALDRYLAITKPFKYTSSVTRSKARCFIALIWINSAGIAFIPVQLKWWRDETSECAQRCYNDDECCDFMTNQTYAAVSSSISFYIPLIIMIFSYSIVFKEAIRLASQIDSQTGYVRRASMPGTNRPLWSREQRRTVFTFGLIMGIFTACWLPFFIVNMIHAFCEECVSSTVFTTLNWIGYSNSFFNPFIYSHNAQFRQAFVRLLTCLPCSEGFERTKRASLSDSFPRYRDSQRDSTLHMLTAFFLNGGSSRKRSSRRSATSSTVNMKRDSTFSRGSSTRSPERVPRFRLGSDDFDICSTDNNNDFSSVADYKKGTPAFQQPEIPGSRSHQTRGNISVCFADERHRQNGDNKICLGNTNGLHRGLEADSPPSCTNKDIADCKLGPLSLHERPPRYSLVGEVDFLTCDSNENDVKFPLRSCNGVQKIRTRRSKSLFVTARDVEVMNRVRELAKKNTKLSCSNSKKDCEEKVIVEPDLDSEASPLLHDKIHAAALDVDSGQITQREGN